MNDDALDQLLTHLPKDVFKGGDHRRLMRAIEGNRVFGASIAVAIIGLTVALSLLFPVEQIASALWSLAQALMGLMPVRLAAAVAAISLLAIEMTKRN